MSNLSELKDQLNNLCFKLDRNYNINKGGCCFVASIITNQLEKRNIKYKLVLQDSTENPIKNHKLVFRCSCKLRNVIPAFRSFSHYAIYIKDVGIINPLPLDSDENLVYVSYINSSDLTYLYDVGIWNDEYNVKNNPLIENKIINFFKNYYEKEKSLSSGN